MNKLYTIAATSVIGIALATSITSPAAAHYSNDHTQKSNSKSSSHDKDKVTDKHISSTNNKDHSTDYRDNETKMSDKKDTHKSNDGHKSDIYTHKPDQDEAKKHTPKPNDKEDDDKKYQPCHEEDNHDKEVPKVTPVKTEKKDAAVQPASVAAKTEPPKPTVLPETGGVGNVALIGSIVAIAGYAFSMLRLKLRTNE